MGYIMRYYVTSDTHGFYTPFKQALTVSGFFTDKEPHKLIICGDLFDEGFEALALQEFIVDLLEKDQVILVKGNHDDLAMDLVHNWLGEKDKRHLFSNGTINTICQLTHKNILDLYLGGNVEDLFADTPFITKIIPAMVNYFETEHYIFVHGWIPFNPDKFGEGNRAYYDENWRNADENAWKEAYWENGIIAAHNGVIIEDKTIVCGHWHCSFGHFYYEKEGDEFSNKANFNPYYAEGIIAIDACTVHSGKVNCLVLED